MAVDFSQPENEEDDDEELSSVDITEEAIPASFIKRYMESAYEDTLSLLKENDSLRMMKNFQWLMQSLRRKMFSLSWVGNNIVPKVLNILQQPKQSSIIPSSR